MSLVICGSAQEGYGAVKRGIRSYGGTGIERPAQFQNHLVSPLIIKPNSQIAVQSCKINKNAIFEVNTTNVFYVYMGRDLANNTSMNDYGNQPIPIRLSAGSYDSIRLATEIQNALNTSYMNPEWFGGFTCSAELNSASGTIACIQFSATQKGSSKTGNANLVVLQGLKSVEWTDWLPASELYWDKKHDIEFTGRFGNRDDTGSGGYEIFFPSGNKDFTNFKGGTAYSASAIQFKRTADTNPNDLGSISPNMWDYDCVGIMGNGSAVPPIGLCEGFVDVDFRYAGTWAGTANESQNLANPWRIGLTRPTNFVPNVGGHNTNRASDDSGFPFWDYCVEFDGVKINCYHACMDGDLSTFTERQRSWRANNDVTYNGEPIAQSVLNTSGAGNYCKVRFSTFGDHIKVSLLDEANGNELKIIDQATHSTKQDHNFKPITDNTTALYLKLQLFNKDDELWITQYDAHTPGDDQANLTYKYPKVSQETNASGLYTIDAGDSFWANTFWGHGSVRRCPADEVKNWADTSSLVSRLLGFTDPSKAPSLNRINSRRFPDFAGNQEITSTGDVDFAGVNANTGIDWSSVFILGKDGSSDYDQLAANYTPKQYIGQYPNMATQLGYIYRPVLKNSMSTTTANENIITYQGSEPPLPAGKEAFVRLSNGTQTSYNANKGSISKILYPIPRFDNSGRSYGQLFFEASEKTYIDFNNVNELILNDIAVEIVDINERPVSDLTGETIVIFHIKQHTSSCK